MILSAIYIYPIKSLGAVALPKAEIVRRGLAYDRRWMLVDSNGRFISQRECPQMVFFEVTINEKALNIIHTTTNQKISIPLDTYSSEELTVTVWKDECKAHPISAKIDKWFSKMLGQNCRLVYMSDDFERSVKNKYAVSGEIVNFSDGTPFLIIGEASLQLLNSKLEIPVKMNRFRPNFVFSGGEAHDEDKWLGKDFKIGSINFKAIEYHGRCNMVNLSGKTAKFDVEPLKTLATYRRIGKKVAFGQSLMTADYGKTIQVGDKISG